MRAAPPAQAALSGGRLERALVLALHMLAALVLVAWLHRRLGLTGALPALACLWALACLGRALARRLMPVAAAGSGTQALRWDGQRWWLLPAQAQALPLERLAVHIDLGPWLLLRLRPADAPRRALWRVVSRASAGTGWHGVRVALQAHAGQNGQPALQGQGGGPGTA